MTQPVIGKRIVIYGATGSGKTTLARHLASVLGLTRIELDAIRHANGWESTPWDEFEAMVRAKLDEAKDGWVCDGNYNRARPIALSRADTIIWLHLPWRVSFWRLLRRTLRRVNSPAPLYDGSSARESWRGSFASSQSVLWWSIQHHQATVRETRVAISSAPAGALVYELRTARDVQAFTDAVSRVRPPTGSG